MVAHELTLKAKSFSCANQQFQAVKFNQEKENMD